MADNRNFEHLNLVMSDEGAPFEEGKNPYPDTPESIAFYEKLRQEIESLPD